MGALRPAAARWATTPSCLKFSLCAHVDMEDSVVRMCFIIIICSNVQSYTRVLWEAF